MTSLRKFISQASIELATEFFERHGLTLTGDDLKLPPAQIADRITDMLRQKPVGTQSGLQQEIETVEKLATEAGENAIEDTTVHEELGSLPSRLARSLWVFLNDPKGFRRAEEIVFHDAHRYGRQWTPFAGIPGHRLRDDPAARQAFIEALKVHFDSANVHLDIFERSRATFGDNASKGDDGGIELVQITIYRETRPTTEPAFVDNTFTYQTRSPVIEAAVTYEPLSGRIECVASQRASRDEVVKQFAITMLGCSPEIEPCAQKSYDLTVLAQPLEFDIDEGDRIEAVGVTMLRLKPIDASPERITIDRMPNNERNIWQVADERLGKNALARDYQISQAQIAIRWRAEGDNRVRTLRVGITHPYKSDIKEMSGIERLVASKYLPRWGLVVEG